MMSPKGVSDGGGMIFSAVEDNRNRLWVVREDRLDVIDAKGVNIGSYGLA